MHRAKGKPRIVVLDGEELRRLVHTALFPAGSAAGRNNRENALVTFGVAGLTFILATLMAHQAADWFLAVPFGVVMAFVVGVRLAMKFR